MSARYPARHTGNLEVELLCEQAMPLLSSSNLCSNRLCRQGLASCRRRAMNPTATGSQGRRPGPVRIRTAVSGLLLSAWLRAVRPVFPPLPIAGLLCPLRSPYAQQLPPPAHFHKPQCAVCRAWMVLCQVPTQLPQAVGSPEVHRRDRAMAPSASPPRLSRARIRPAGPRYDRRRTSCPGTTAAAARVRAAGSSCQVAGWRSWRWRGPSSGRGCFASRWPRP